MSIRAYQVAKEWAREPSATLLCITSDERSAERFARDLEFFSKGRVKGDVYLFPSPDVVPYSHVSPPADIWIDRLRVLYQLHSLRTMAVVAPAHAVLRRVPPCSIFSRHTRTVHQHESISRDELARWLVEAGYINQPIVEEEGSFSIRGGIFDIFSPAMDRPVRLELDGDEISTIRTFEPSTQRSSFAVSSFTIIPVRNAILDRENKDRALSQLKALADDAGIKPGDRRETSHAIEQNFYSPEIETLMPLFYDKTASVTDYLPAKAKIFLDDGIEAEAERDRLWTLLEKSYGTAKGIEKIVRPEMLYDRELPEGVLTLHQKPVIPAQAESPRSQLDPRLRGDDNSNFSSAVEELYPLFLKSRPAKGESHLGPLMEGIKKWQELGLQIIITCHTTTQADRLLDIIRWKGHAAEVADKTFAEVRSQGRSTVWIMLGALSKGFIHKEDKLVVLTDEDIFGSKTPKKVAPSEPLETFTDFSQLGENDLIIHKEHGIGRYLGLKNLDIRGTKNDFLLLQYLGNDKLYLPVWKINLISRYIGDADTVTLDRLGGTRWTKTQNKVTAEIRTMAMELLKIYAQRQTQKGFSFGPRDQLLEEFEAAFPYDETPDQWRSIEETLADMQGDKPTDRLICGDVGYGKTEVAMRAAFRAVADKKQVAILVPTTVLAFQHYENFMNRFANWPVRIEMLSRFRSRTEQKHILTELARGMVDVVIGTHRLLQRDVKFNDLGLLIIDEEHRFGVTHKERIKKLRATVDTIAMSATPIPRTLHLSLSGLRDISIINTPPANRLAIRTYVSEFNEDIVRGAILGELSRGGQVFFVHNRVEEIYRMEELLKRLVPEAKVVVGHGQMEEHELEEVMIKFLEKKANVLLCTTIIESGIDVPTANTIIINRADRMGLAQLYQLRGRVGRSNVQAYAYLLTPAEETISPIAKKRLALLQRYTELGSGFQIAMHDLEIRGAGNILGAEQSGHINAIGYEMYMDLLERTIRHLQGQPERVKVDVEITLPIPAYIPTDYIADEGQRLITYRRLSSLEDIAALDDVAKELNERYGKIPDLVNNLLGIVEMRINAKKFLVESINFDGKIFAVKFSPKTGIDPNKILNLVKQAPQKYAFRQPATLLMKESAKHPKDIFSVLRALFGTLEK